jgi:cytoskeleton protein RodZ
MPTVGETLSAERRRQGKSIADAVGGTKIRGRLLEALEEGRYDDLPSPAYVKGYIQSYARYLEIPAESLLEQFKHESVGTVRRLAPADRYLAEIPAETIVPRREKVHEIPRNVWVALAAAVVIVGLLLGGIAQLFNRNTGANTTPAPIAGAVATSSPGATSSTAATASTTVTTTTAGSFKLRVSVRAGLASYVKVTFDGLNGYVGTLQGGESREFLVTQSAKVTIGKPDAVVVTRDGKPVSVPAGTNVQISLTTTP